MNQNKVFEYQVLIKESHLDFFGHVNNAVYLQLYEEARWDFITQNGRGLEVIARDQIGPVILDLQVRFKREIKNREVILIQSQVKEIVGSKLIVLEQIMIKNDLKVASEATFTIGVFDLKLRKLLDCTDDWYQAVGALPPLA